jgi:multidrug transporter EmrE-like cation transporter
MLRVFEHKGGNRTVIIASNYIVSGTMAYLFSVKMEIEVPILVFGVVLGLFFFMAFVIFSKAIRAKGIAGAVTVGRLSLAVPVSFSILLWGEQPLLIDIISLILIFVIILSWEDKIGKVSPILGLLFVLFGLIDSAMKYFKLTFPRMDDGFLLIIVFYSALVWSWSYLAFNRIKPGKRDFFHGLLLGVPNFFSSYFLLKALDVIPAYVVFPFVNIGVIISSALVGHLVFRERLSRKRVLLVALGIVAVLSLTASK